MLTFDDCLDMTELTEDEIHAIAEHEHIPEICALELGEHLCHIDGGYNRIRRFIVDDIDEAESRGNHKHADELRETLSHFDENHPPGTQQ